MFRNKEDARETQLTTPPTTGKNDDKGGSTTTHLGRGTQVEGDLRSTGSLFVDGTVKGSLATSADLQIGTEGRVEAEVEARNITVAGTVKGRIFADGKVVLLAGSRVEGDIHAQSLKIDDSVFFQGGCVMGEGARKRRADSTPLPESVKKLKLA